MGLRVAVIGSRDTGAAAIREMLRSPGAGLVRPLVLRLGRVLSRKVPAASWADLTLSPLQLYVSRLQQRIAGQPSHGIS